MKSPKQTKINQDIIDDYKKLCLKSYIQTNNQLISTLKSETLILNPEFTMKEILIINKLIGKHLAYKNVMLETNESLKGISSFIFFFDN